VRPLVSLLAALGLLSAVAPTAQARPVIGIGEQNVGVFSDPTWQALGVRRMRLVVAWDALQSDWQRAEADAYLAAAQAQGAQVVLAFGRSRVVERREWLPSIAIFRRAFAAWRARYPTVSEYIAWNEANHCSQPTCHRPEVAARYYNALRADCPTCTIAAASVLDGSRMPGWVRRFQRVARDPDRRLIWGLHNYIDANRFRTRGTRSLLRVTKGRIWFTETGGLVYRKDGPSQVPFPEGARHAARATRWVLRRLAPLSRRVTRVYFYHWLPPAPGSWWDSALVDRRGRPRPALAVLRAYLRR
jgi:hypothetical protein